MIEGLDQVVATSRIQTVQEKLKAYFRDRGFSPGDKLPSEGEMAESLGVSRNSLRESIRSLEALGLIEVRHGLGWYVRSPSLEAVAEALVLSVQMNAASLRALNDIRICLECSFLPTACCSLGTDDINLLDRLVDEMRDRVRRGVVPVEPDQRFHRTLFCRLDNAFFLGLMDAIWRVYRSVGERSDMSVEERMSKIELHQTIVDALRAGDGELAARRLRDSHAGTVLGWTPVSSVQTDISGSLPAPKEEAP